MDNYGRREWIKRAGLATMVITLPGFSCQKNRAREEGSSSARKKNGSGILVAPHNSLVDGENKIRFLHLGQAIVAQFKIPLQKSHSVISGFGRGEVIVSECGGASTAIVNVKTSETKFVFGAESGRVFGGHAVAWRAQGKLICPEFNPAKPTESFLTVRDAKDKYKVISRFETRGARPHGVFILDDAKLLAVQHFAKDPCDSSYASSSKYTYFGLPDFNFVESKTLMGNPADINITPIYLTNEVPAKLTNEDLKIVAHELAFRKLVTPSARAAATIHSDRRTVLLWRLRDLRLVSSYRLKDLTPVEALPSADRSTLVIGTVEGSLIYVDLESKERSESWPKVTDMPVASHFSIL